jgi:hypothetical protein
MLQWRRRLYTGPTVICMANLKLAFWFIIKWIKWTDRTKLPLCTGREHSHTVYTPPSPNNFGSWLKLPSAGKGSFYRKRVKQSSASQQIAAIHLHSSPLMPCSIQVQYIFTWIHRVKHACNWSLRNRKVFPFIQVSIWQRHSSSPYKNILNYTSRYLMFNVHGSVHRNNILVYDSNYMHKSQNVFYLTTALHVWNWSECVVGGVRHPQHTQISSNSSTIVADNSTV